MLDIIGHGNELEFYYLRMKAIEGFNVKTDIFKYIYIYFF